MRLIDADALEKAINKWMPKAQETWMESEIPPIEILAESVLLTIDEQPTVEVLPSAEKTGKWIPVSERLPEEDTEVLICYKYREGEGDTNHARIDITSYGDMYFGGNRIAQTKHWRQPFEYFALNYEVVAWMPLPEPYKGQTNCGARMVE